MRELNLKPEAASALQIQTIDLDGQALRVGIRPGSEASPPLLVFNGVGANLDPIVPLTNARILAARIPGARLHVIDDGHLFLVARAAEVAPVIRKFLRQASC